MTYPIPSEALDDRIGILGTSGSGKTYLLLGAMARLMSQGARVVGVDPLGVMWGLRLTADGKHASAFPVVIFGGTHGDLPLTENSGAMIGETVATMAESCILDLSDLPTKSAERRFMVAFLTALYQHTDGRKRDPYHLMVDEADRFAPQKPPAGDEVLLNRMEEIVRRGRVRGFIPWLITQRPAVLNKNVLSMVDGLILLSLTSPQDRAAAGTWIEGQADKAEGKRILGQLPAMQRGEGVVWFPRRKVLETVKFPPNSTFDSSRTPKRGERGRNVEPQPLDLAALKEKLAAVETEAKANDPAALKAEISVLKRALFQMQEAAKDLAAKVTDPAALDRARAEGFRHAQSLSADLMLRLVTSAGRLKEPLEAIAADGAAMEQYLKAAEPAAKAAINAYRVTKAPIPVLPPDVKPSVKRAPILVDGLDGPQTRVMAAVGFWKAVGTAEPSRAQVAGVAGYSPGSGGFNNLVGKLIAGGRLSIPAAGRLAAVGYAPTLTREEARGQLRDGVLGAPERKLVDAALGFGSISRAELADRTEYSAGSGGFNNLVGKLCTLDIFKKPGAGMVALSDWARQVLE